MAASRALPAGDVFRARLILLLAEGRSYAAIKRELHTTAPSIARRKQRFLEKRLDGLVENRHPGRRPTVITPQPQARVLAATQRPPKDRATHWSCRKLARELGLSKDTVHRIWRTAGLKPHRLERYMASNDPDFERKAAHIIGLYLDPPQHAAVFYVDEKSAIQALDRLDPVLPLSPGRLERHGFESYRHGTLSLYAALDVETGKVHGRTAARHTSEDFLGFLGDVVHQAKGKREIHIILDNLSADKTKKVEQFLQIEIWFARIERGVIARGVFTSVPDLARRLMRYIRAYSRTARPSPLEVHRCPPPDPTMIKRRCPTRS